MEGMTLDAPKVIWFGESARRHQFRVAEASGARLVRRGDRELRNREKLHTRGDRTLRKTGLGVGIINEVIWFVGGGVR